CRLHGLSPQPGPARTALRQQSARRRSHHHRPWTLRRRPQSPAGSPRSSARRAWLRPLHAAGDEGGLLRRGSGYSTRREAQALRKRERLSADREAARPRRSEGRRQPQRAVGDSEFYSIITSRHPLKLFCVTGALDGIPRRNVSSTSLSAVSTVISADRPAASTPTSSSNPAMRAGFRVASVVACSRLAPVNAIKFRTA